MFPGFTNPRTSPGFGCKEFNSVFVRKPKDPTENLKYANLNEPVISRGRKTMGKDFQGFFFTSMDSSSEDDDRTNYKPSRRNVLQKSYSVESARSSEDACSSPIPELNFPVYDPYCPATNRKKFTKMAGKTMKTMLSSLSPKVSKKNYPVPVCSPEPVWPNSMNTFARGITTSKEQPSMSAPQEQSLASLRIQLDGEERELLRQAAKAAIFTGDLLRFDSPSPPNSLPEPGVLTSSYSDSDLYYPPCQKCMMSVDQQLHADDYEREAIHWSTTAIEGASSNNTGIEATSYRNAARIQGNHLVLAEGPPEDDFFA